MEPYDVIIIGGGPAGLTAGLYASRMELKTVLFEKMLCGGQMNNTELIENYMGYESIKGFELSQIMESHAKKFGTKIIIDEVVDIIKTENIFTLTTKKSNKVESRSVIIATGAVPSKLGVLGEERFLGRGVSYCAICDGAFFKDAIVAVVGGGDAAVEESIFLTKYAKKVYLIHRRDALRASKYYQNQLFSNDKIEVIWNSIITEITGDNSVSGLLIKNAKNNEISKISTSGLFIFIGYSHSKIFFEKSVKLDEQGFYITDSNMMTNIDGLFAIGDGRSRSARQISAAVGDGTIASIAAHKYLGYRF